MASIARTSARLGQGSSARNLSTSAICLAAKSGKAAQKPAKKKAAAFSQNKAAAPKRAGGGGGSSSGVVLRYAEASDAPDLADFDKFIPDVIGSSSVGRATTFPQKTFEQLKLLGLPRRLEKELERGGGPAAVVREATVKLAKLLDAGKGSSSKDARHILTGESGSGKSMLLLQTAAYALESGWIVLYVPRGQLDITRAPWMKLTVLAAAEWIQSSGEYRYHAETKSFHQPALAASLLDTLLTVNRKALSGITAEKQIGTSAKGTALDEVCRAVVKSDQAVDVLVGVLDALAKQTQVPVLLAIDEVQALFSTSQVRTPDYSILESYYLSTPSLALEYLTGKKTFAKGMIVSSLSHSTPSLPISTTLRSTLDLPSSTPITPYTKHNPVHLANAQSGLNKIDVPWTMSAEEAAGIWRIWAKKGWARGTDETFLGALTASSGNMNEFTRGLSRNLQALPA